MAPIFLPTWYEYEHTTPTLTSAVLECQSIAVNDG